MGMYTGMRLGADEVQIYARPSCVIIVNPCGERLSFVPEEARKLVERLTAAIESSEKQRARVLESSRVNLATSSIVTSKGE